MDPATRLNQLKQLKDIGAISHEQWAEQQAKEFARLQSHLLPTVSESDIISVFVSRVQRFAGCSNTCVLDHSENFILSILFNSRRIWYTKNIPTFISLSL
jgi:hypothetical protein